MALRPDEQVNLKGKFFPLYKGVLREAHENGLLELSVKLLEAPSEANGWTAISEATAVFPGPEGRDRIFVEIGDANAKNTGPMIAVHAIRMSATRAKGRALRDALGIGEALIEEMGPDAEATAGRDGAAHSGVQQQGGTRGAAAAREQPRTGTRAAPVGDTAGDRRAAAGSLGERPVAPAVAPVEFCEQCGAPIDDARVVALSEQKFKRCLCVSCGRALLAVERANLPTGEIAA